MATNLLKHAGGAEIVVARFYDHHGSTGLELLSLDKGAGIPSVVVMRVSVGPATA